MQPSNLVILLLISFSSLAVAYREGAPRGTCGSMRPSHRQIPPQSDDSPYSVIVREMENKAHITIEDSSKRKTFRGFMLRAILENNSEYQGGPFTAEQGISHILDCGSGKSALTHSNNGDKVAISTVWSPPAGFSGSVIFRATVVEKFDKYWLKVDSNPISLSSIGSSTHQVDQDKTTTTPHRSLSPPTNVYSSCGVTKGCFGLEKNCIEKRSCEIILTYSISGNEVDFQMIGALGPNNGWIAMGLSRDDKMGDDTVTECIFSNGRVIVQESWNIGQPRKNNIPSTRDNNIRNQRGEYDEGIITCQWSRPLRTSSNGITFNVDTDKFFILLARGPLDGSGRKDIHTAQLSSAYAADIMSISLVVGKSSVLIKLHGALMTVAWICFVSIGILLARHYKESWSGYNLCNNKVWFAVHRCFMIISICCVIAGFIVIFIDVDGWSNVAPNPHPVLGVISTALIILQPFIAACRPSPTHPKRPIFRWVHGVIGNGAQLIACINLFFAVGLSGSNLPLAFSYVLITFLIFHCLVHLLIHIHTCFMERERQREGVSKSNQFQLGDGYDLNQDAPGSAFKKFALGLYSLVNVCLTAALVLMICLN